MLNAQVEHSASVSEPAWLAYTTASPDTIGLHAPAVLTGFHTYKLCSLFSLWAKWLPDQENFTYVISSHGVQLYVIAAHHVKKLSKIEMLYNRYIKLDKLQFDSLVWGSLTLA